MALLPTNAVEVARFANALYGKQIGSITNTNVNNDITASGSLTATLNAYYYASFGNTATATVTATLLSNLGIASTDAGYSLAQTYIKGQLDFAVATARGAVVKQLLDHWAGLTTDATYGAAATAWNAKIDSAIVYTTYNTDDAVVGYNAGQTLMLTKGLDNVPGTSGNDTIIGSISTNAELNTVSALDILAGGSGVDTLKISSDVNKVVIPNMTGVEVVEVSGAGGEGVTVDTSAKTDVTNLNIIKAEGSVAATAGSTTDIDVSIKDAANATTITAVGGKNVNVALTNAVSDIAVGGDFSGEGKAFAAGKAPTGAVTITATGAAASNANGDVSLGDIYVNGGTTINVTQHATSDASALVAGGTKVTHNQGDVTVVASAATTTVTVKQDAAATKASVAAVTGVTEVASVKFADLAKDASVTVGGLTFTAGKALTAAQVAQAFANLSATAITPTDLTAQGEVAAGTADGDTQGSGVYSNGTFTGSLVAGWNSGAASGDTVTFTASKAKDITDLEATGATLTTTTQGVDAVAAKNTLGITAGAVVITDGAALTTVTVDGYAATGSQIKGTAGKLETLNLSHGGAFTVADTAATLALNLEKVGSAATAAALTLTAAPTTLNVKSTGANYLDLTAAATTALNVSGTGVLSTGSSTLTSLETIKVTETAGLNLGGADDTLTSVDTTGTTGAVTVSIQGTLATYAGGAGVDKVTITNADTAISKAIDLGAGDDTLILAGTNPATLPTVTLKGGDGVDTLSMSVASAAALDADGKFAAKLSGFEHLTLNTAGANEVVNLDNLGFSYVTTSGSAKDKTLTLDKMANDGTVVLTAAGVIVVTVKDADLAGNTTDVLNVVARVDSDVTHGQLTVANVETINIKAEDSSPVDTTTGAATINTSTLTLGADSVTTVKVNGNANLDLRLTADKLATINAADLTGDLTVSATGKVAMAITGGSGDDSLTASAGASAKADVLVGGAGNDTLVAGSNSASLTGGDGNDTFVLTASAVDAGSKHSNTYSTIEDFKAGDLLQLQWFDNTDADTEEEDVQLVGTSDVVSFAKLGAVMQPTAQLSDYVLAAMEQMNTDTNTGGDAVWFKIGSDSYVVVDSGAASTGTFTSGEDMIVKLAGVDLANASWNGQFSTIALI